MTLKGANMFSFPAHLIRRISQAVSNACLQQESVLQVSGYSDKTWLRSQGTRVNPEQIEQSVNDSLQRLQTDHLDLLQIHWPDRYHLEFASVLRNLQKIACLALYSGKGAAVFRVLLFFLAFQFLLCFLNLALDLFGFAEVFDCV